MHSPVVRILFIVGLARSCVSADAVPNFEDLAKAPNNEKPLILSTWAANLEQSSSATRQKIQPLLARLSNIASESPQLIESVAAVFRALGDPSPECLAFCHTVLNLPDDEPGLRWLTATQLLGQVRATDAESKQLIIARISSSKCPVLMLNYLAANHPNDQDVKALVINNVSSEIPAVQRASIKAISNLTLNADERLRVSKVFLALASNVNSDPTALHLIGTILRKSPMIFKETFEPAQADDLLKLCKSDNAEIQTIGVAMALIAPKDQPPNLAPTLIEVIRQKKAANATLFCIALGYLRAVSSQSGDKLIDLARVQLPEARSGVFSFYWRSGTSYQTSAKTWRDQLEKFSSLDKNYELGFGESLGKSTSPESWRRVWQNCTTGALKDIAEVRDAVMHSLLEELSTNPDHSDATWLLEQFLSHGQFDDDILGVVWACHTRAKSLATAKGFKEFLERKVDDRSNVANSIKAAGLLVALFGERSAIQKILNDTTNDAIMTSRWPVWVDILLEYDPSNKRLDEFRNMLLTAKYDNKWFIWLLDIRRGAPFTPVPVESLAAALRFEAQSQQLPWLESVVAAGNSMFPYLSELRQPFFLIAGSADAPRSVLQFLGAIDRLELAKRQAAEKKP